MINQILYGKAIILNDKNNHKYVYQEAIKKTICIFLLVQNLLFQRNLKITFLIIFVLQID